MGYEDRSDRGFDRGAGRGGGRGFRGGRDFGPKEMHKATCSECGQECEVPFKPGKDADGNPRPVYCKECYRKRKSY
ncbi:DNA-directed RNA polymerase [Candidatus Woesearchaeota archaeon]|nr:DNA-directed RNA polymerase [Candidatus Woesearchaeota archaeon]